MQGDERTGRRFLLSVLPTARERSSGVRRLRVADLPALRNAARTDRRAGHRLILLCSALLLIACSDKPAPLPANGFAYVGPPALNLRKDLGARAVNVATVQHGERLEVL